MGFICFNARSVNKTIYSVKNINIKDLVWVITLVASVVGTYYTLNYKTQRLEEKVEYLEHKYESTNIEVLKNDIEYVKKDIGEIKIAIKDQFNLVNSILLDD